MKDKFAKYRAYLKNLSKTDKLILLVALVGAVIRIIYIGYTKYNVRQHDLLNLQDTEGHIGYIKYWYNHFQLPDFDPRILWQFYQPPLHHIIAALWVKLNVFVGFSFTDAFENLQILTLIYSYIITYISYRILKELGITGRGLVISFTLVCLHPIMILFSGSINNDILCLLFVMAAILETIKWYKKSSMKRIIAIALCLGLSMMVKTSGVLIAPGIAFIFIYKLIQHVAAWKIAIQSEKREQLTGLLSIVKQYFVFLAISVPIGMWWSVYNLVRFGLPFGYVPRLSDDLDQYLGAYPVWKRFFDFDLAQVKYVFQNWGKPCYEHNIFIAIVKTSLFGEYGLDKDIGYITRPATILFWTNVILSILSVVAILYVIVKKSSNISSTLKFFLAIVYVTILGSYFQFCLQFPHTCTMDFRYIVPTMIIGSIAIGQFINELDRKKTDLTNRIVFVISVVTLIFAVFSVLTYFVLGLA